MDIVNIGETLTIEILNRTPPTAFSIYLEDKKSTKTKENNPKPQNTSRMQIQQICHSNTELPQFFFKKTPIILIKDVFIFDVIINH